MVGMAAPFDVAKYTDLKEKFASRDECFAAFGVGVRCKSHCARVVKTAGAFVHLRCRLRASDPPCHWAAVAATTADDVVELRMLPENKCGEHNGDSAMLGKPGPPS